MVPRHHDGGGVRSECWCTTQLWQLGSYNERIQDIQVKLIIYIITQTAKYCSKLTHEKTGYSILRIVIGGALPIPLGNTGVPSAPKDTTKM